MPDNHLEEDAVTVSWTEFPGMISTMGRRHEADFKVFLTFSKVGRATESAESSSISAKEPLLVDTLVLVTAHVFLGADLSL